MTTGKEYVASVFEKVKAQNAHEPEFLQAVEEVFESLIPAIVCVRWAFHKVIGSFGRVVLRFYWDSFY